MESTATSARHPLLGTSTIEVPVLATIPVAQRLSGLSRSEIYRRLAAGDVRAVKNNGRTLIVMASLLDYLGNLPDATFRAPKAA